MAKKGSRFPLLIYEYTLGRWWTATLAISIVLFILWWFLPTLQPGKTQSDWKDTALLLISGAALLMTIFFYTMRKAAYVRPYLGHLRLVTPFLRLNISYKRILKTRATEMSTLFRASKLSGMQRESMGHLLAKTVLVIDLNAFPIPLSLLRFFLSPFFFKDKTPHFVLLVKDWMRFSTELESFRTGGGIAREKEKDSVSSILSTFSKDE